MSLWRASIMSSSLIDAPTPPQVVAQPPTTSQLTRLPSFARPTPQKLSSCFSAHPLSSPRNYCKDVFTDEVHSLGRASAAGPLARESRSFWRRQHRVYLKDRRSELAPWRYRGYVGHCRLFARSQMELDDDQGRSQQIPRPQTRILTLGQSAYTLETGYATTVR